MKKFIAMLLTGVMVCSALTGCGNEANNDNSNDAASTAVSGESTTENGEDSSASGLSIDIDNLSAKPLGAFKVEDFLTLGDYEGVPVNVALESVTEDKITEYIENIKSTNPPTVEVTDRAVQDGDTVNIDYVGKYADTKEAFDGGTAQGADLVIGSGSYIEGFESGLVGVEKGQTVDLDLTFPENYGAENLAGKAVVFTVTINSIKAPAEDITDEWAAGLGYEGVSNLEELKQYAEKKLQDSAQQTYESSLESAVIEKVTENTTFGDMPEELVNWYLKQQYEIVGYTAQMYSYYYGQDLTVGDIINMYMQNEGVTGTAEDYLRDISTEMAQQYAMFQAIANEQGIVITNEDVDTYLKNLYDNAATTAYSSYEEYRANLDVEIYREMLMAEEVVKFLKEKANASSLVNEKVETPDESAAEGSSSDVVAQ
jgi:trigger factor